jgi:hypothetical protein
MIGHALTIFIAFAYRFGAAPPDVCPESFSNDRSSIFRRPRRLILPLSTSQPIPFSVAHTHQKSSNRHSKLSSISETASFK